MLKLTLQFPERFPFGGEFASGGELEGFHQLLTLVRMQDMQSFSCVIEAKNEFSGSNYIRLFVLAISLFFYDSKQTNVAGNACSCIAEIPLPHWEPPSKQNLPSTMPNFLR